MTEHGRSPVRVSRAAAKIERAKQCLRNPRCSVNEAGMEAGFQNPSHFARVFRKLVGITPSRFRSEV